MPFYSLESNLLLNQHLNNKRLHKIFIFYLLLILILLPGIALTQTNYYNYPVNFDHYTTEEGMSQNAGNCFAQDKKGFLWIGTNSSLERFDGYSFTSYKPNIKDSTSISGNTIWSLYVDNYNDLWIGTFEKGLNKYNRDMDNFTRYLNNPNDSTSLSHNSVTCIFQDFNENYWIGTKGGGINLFNKNSEKFTHFSYKTNIQSDSNDIIHDYCLNNEGLIWLGTEDGIIIFNPVIKQFKDYYKKPGDLNAVKNIPILTLSTDNEGKFWIGTWTKGIFTFDSNTGKIKNYVYYPNNPKTPRGNIIWSIVHDSFGQVWIGTNKGLLKYNKETDDFMSYVADISDNKSISENFIRKIFEDQKGVLWIGTNNSGLNKLDLYQKKFRHFAHEKENPKSLSNSSVNTIYEDYAGRIWIGTEEGLNLYDNKTNNFITYINKQNEHRYLAINYIVDIEGGKPPNIWLATGYGISQFNTNTQKFTNYWHDPENPNSLSNNSAFCLYNNNDSILWIGTWGGGLDKLELENKKFINYPIDSINTISNVVLSIAEDDNNKLWLGTYGKGLVKFDKNNEKLTYHEPDPDNPGKIDVPIYLYRIEDKIWLCTGGGSLSTFYTNGDHFLSFNAENDLPNVEIKGILGQDENNFWISTGKGLSKLEFIYSNDSVKPNFSFTNYDKKDGLKSNVFNQGACLKSSTGEMYFGGISGFNIFHPDSIFPNPFKPEVIISNFYIFNKIIKRGQKINGRIILTKPIFETEKIKLSYQEYVFSIEFAALHFASPEKIQYTYILEGFDKEWIRTNASRRYVSYSNLEAGEYVFKVKAANNNGVWNEDECKLTIIILQPWWKTWWIKIIFLLLIIITAISFYLIRTDQLKKQSLLLKQKVEERTRELQQAYKDLEESQEEIKQKNEELKVHQNLLEEMVEERTKELVVALSKAEESDKLKTAFIANISHEIRTPMNAIIGFSSLLKTKSNLTVERKNKYIDIINNNCKALLVLINDILDISKIEANKIVITKNKFSVSLILEELYDFLKINAKKKIDCKLITPLKKVVIENDANRFRQVFSNLLTNAIKYTEKGHIHFGFEPENGNLRFFVADTGIGIAESEFQNIFNPFKKIEDIKTKLYSGTGLGLAICKSLVEQMGGKIWVESEVGKGSIFSFTLPYK